MNQPESAPYTLSAHATPNPSTDNHQHRPHQPNYPHQIPSTDEVATSHPEQSHQHEHTVHSETEKRRRNKLNQMIHELAQELAIKKPSTSGRSNKLDKTSVLKEALRVLKERRLGGTCTEEAETAQLESSLSPCPEIIELVLDLCKDSVILLVDADEEGDALIHFASSSLHEILGWKVHEWSGRSLFSMAHPEDREILRRQLLFVPQPTAGEVSRTNWRRAFGMQLLSKEEKWVPMECRGCIHKLSAKEEKHVLFLMAHPLDLDKSTEGEATLRLDQDGIITQADPTVVNLIGYFPHQMVTRNVRDFFHEEDKPTLERALAQVMTLATTRDLTSGDRQVTVPQPVRIQSKNGAWFQCRMSLSVVWNPLVNKLLCLVMELRTVRTSIELPQNVDNDDTLMAFLAELVSEHKADSRIAVNKDTVQEHAQLPCTLPPR